MKSARESCPGQSATGSTARPQSISEIAAEVARLAATTSGKEEFTKRILAWADQRYRQQVTEQAFWGEPEFVLTSTERADGTVANDVVSGHIDLEATHQKWKEQEWAKVTELSRAKRIAVESGQPCPCKPEVDSTPLPFPSGASKRTLSMNEKYVILAAIHDAMLSASDGIGPAWDAGDKATWSYGVLVETGAAAIGEKDLPELQLCLESVGHDLHSHSTDGQGKEQRQPSFVREWDDTKLSMEIILARRRNPSISVPQLAMEFRCDKTTLYRRAEKNPAINDLLYKDGVVEPSAHVERRESAHRGKDRINKLKRAEGTDRD